MSSSALTTILITGATGAIGNALARQYAKPDVFLVLQGRNETKLKKTASQCKTLGAAVSTVKLDLCDISALQTWITELTINQTPDLVIVNAGMNINLGASNEGEQWEEMESLLDLNIKASFALINAVLPSMRQRGSGQIAIISSLAAYYGLPITPSYCASKAALKTYGEALRGWLAQEGIKINVIMPGYVKSDMCQNMPGPKPFLWSPEKAAKVIVKGLYKNKSRISFPFPLNLGTWFLSVLPPSWSQWTLKVLNYGS